MSRQQFACEKGGRTVHFSRFLHASIFPFALSFSLFLIISVIELHKDELRMQRGRPLPHPLHFPFSHSHAATQEKGRYHMCCGWNYCSSGLLFFPLSTTVRYRCVMKAHHVLSQFHCSLLSMHSADSVLFDPN